MTGEFADLRAMAFYCAAVIVALLLTGCSARLAAARLPLFIRTCPHIAILGSVWLQWSRSPTQPSGGYQVFSVSIC
jgi:hypothetical protein